MGNSVVQHNTGNYWTLLHGIASTKRKKKVTAKIENQFFCVEKMVNLAILFYLSKIDKASKPRSFQIMLRLVKSIA